MSAFSTAFFKIRAMAHHAHAEHTTSAAAATVAHPQHSMHPMAFHFGSAETILFTFWDVNSAIGEQKHLANGSSNR